MTDDDKIATREEVLALLTQRARDGSISAAIALERALRVGGPAEGDDELARLLGELGAP